MKIRVINKNKPNPLLNLKQPPQTDLLSSQQLAITWVIDHNGGNKNED